MVPPLPKLSSKKKAGIVLKRGEGRRGRFFFFFFRGKTRRCRIQLGVHPTIKNRGGGQPRKMEFQPPTRHQWGSLSFSFCGVGSIGGRISKQKSPVNTHSLFPQDQLPTADLFPLCLPHPPPYPRFGKAKRGQRALKSQDGFGEKEGGREEQSGLLVSHPTIVL